MSSKKIAKAFIDETTGRVLDNVHKVLREFMGNKKDAEKVLKYIIKTVIKIGILYKNDQLNSDELKVADAFKQNFHSLCMTVVSFYEVDFTYDKGFLKSAVEECRQLLQQLIARHLTDKSKSRVDHVFDSFNREEFMDAIFQSNGKYKEYMDKIVVDMNKLMDEGNL